MGIIPHEVWDLYKGKVFRLSKERLTLPNGETAELEVIRHPGAAAIVPLRNIGMPWDNLFGRFPRAP
jgi:ADP-ribose pyrophosphatase